MKYAQSDQAERAAHAAAPRTPAEAADMKRAEEAGAAHSKGEGSLVSSKDKTDE